MRVLLTGATGFLGGTVWKILEQNGYQVLATGYTRSEGDVIPVDLTNREQVLSAFTQPCDAIVHLAADMPKLRGEQPNSVMIRNAIMADNVMTLAKLWSCHSLVKSRSCHIVYMSSTAVYGYPERIPVSEDAPVQPDSLYARGKHLAELICQQYEEEYSLPVTVLRISAPYGHGMPQHSVVAKFVKHALLGNDLVLFGTGNRSQDFTYVKDIVQATVKAVTLLANGVFNVGTGVSTPMRTLAELVLDITESKGTIVSSSGIEDLQEHFRMAVDISRAKQVLGYSPEYDLKRGITEYVEQQRSQHTLPHSSGE